MNQSYEDDIVACDTAAAADAPFRILAQLPCGILLCMLCFDVSRELRHVQMRAHFQEPAYGTRDAFHQSFKCDCAVGRSLVPCPDLSSPLVVARPLETFARYRCDVRLCQWRHLP